MVVIPKTVTLTRIIENYKATSLTLDKEDIEKLAGLERNLRLMKVIMGKKEIPLCCSCVCVC